MGKESVIRMCEDMSEPEDNHLTPRCSTPIFDRCVVPPGKSSSQITNREEKNNNDVRLYREWKLRLQRGKTRPFKVRGGTRSRNANTDCSIISGHFESEAEGGAATATAMPTPTPTPVYQMWFPFGYPGFCWSPAHGCQHQNHLWSYGTAQIPHYQRPSQFFGPAEWFFANFCQRTGYQPAPQVLRCNGNSYPANPYHPHIHWPQPQYQVQHHHPFPTYSATPNCYPQFLNRGTVI